MPEPTIQQPGTARVRAVRRAFTLVELLASLAIIGLLAAILFATLSRVRESARQTTCIGRLRELGNVFQLYVNDHRGALPRPRQLSTSRWPLHVASYIGPYQTLYDQNGEVTGVTGQGEIYGTPVLRDPANEYNPTNAAGGTFGCNAALETRQVRWAELSKPGTFPVLASSQGDVGGGLRLVDTGPSPKALELGYTGATHISGPAPNYGRKAMFLFADWHVEARDVCDPVAWPWNDPQAFAVR